MKVKIGIAESSRVVEVVVDDIEAFEKKIESSFVEGSTLLWFEDTKNRRVGIPSSRIAFVEVDQESEHKVGFGS